MNYKLKRAFRSINSLLERTKKFERRRKLFLKVVDKIGKNTKIVGPILITTQYLINGDNY